MITAVFEVYGAFSFFSLIAFLVWAAAAKLRPDLDEEKTHIGDLEEFNELQKFKNLASSEQFGNALPLEDPIVEILSRSAPPARSSRASV